MKRDVLFLGLDSSTQGLKAAAINADLRVVCEASVNFDADLPEFKTRGGAHFHADGVTVTSPPLMWVAAMDLLLDKMAGAGFGFDRVAAVSGSGQQHGSVWLKKEAGAMLAGIDSRKNLRGGLEGAFALAESPIWMDSSTARECAALERALGGPQAVADLTGSRAYERFTGNQIARICRKRPKTYEAAARIGLVSSFMASLLIGKHAPIDTSDGSGMNLMNVRTRDWAPEALKHTAPRLKSRLGRLVPGHAAIGTIHPYFVRKYAFSENCVIIAFSGDNPNSLAGLRLQRPGDIAISLGTSDTLFGSVSNPRPSGSEGHVFASPIDPGAYMVMIVKKNGSLAREKVRDRHAGGSWAAFGRALRATPTGNDGNIAIHVGVPEITPPIRQTGVFRYDSRGAKARSFPPTAEIRALVEGHFLSMRLHGEAIGIRPATVLATGGASQNKDIIKVIADVFGVPVFIGEQANSAAVGAAYRALHGWKCRAKGRFIPFSEALRSARPFKKAAEPDRKAHAIYSRMTARLQAIEKELASAG